MNWEIAAKTKMKHDKLPQFWAFLYNKNIMCF